MSGRDSLSLARKIRLAMVTTHPIQYQVPWLRMLGDRDNIDLHVYFAMLPSSQEQGREFGVAFDWDTPLLDGYQYTVLENVSAQPGLTTWSGCDTPGVYAGLRGGQFDAVIVNGWGSKTAVQALIACRRLRIPCIVRGEANGLRQRNWLKRLGHRVLLSQYSAFLAIGQQNRRYYESLGVSKALIFNTPYCVDNNRFAVVADQVRKSTQLAELRNRFGLDPKAKTFLFSGKFVDKKHPADAIEAIGKLLASNGPAVQLLMVGDGPLRSQLEQAAAGLPIRFAGFLNQSQMALAYAASDCLVLPSDAGETWGLVVNEAMACGLPAIVSDQVGCAFDLVIAGTTGQIYPCRDVSALAARMQEFAANVGRAAEMGSAARRHVESGFNFEGVVDGVLRTLSVVRR
ncbi:MAG: glycosyltransferase family 4 protein [Pseudomarimonas sp.]